MFVNGSGQNEQSLERTFHRYFLPSFTSFGWGVSEEKIKMWKVNGRQTMDAKWWQKLTLPLARWAKKNLNKYTELFRNIASFEIMHVDSFQIGDIRKTVKLPKMALHSLFNLLTTFVNLHWVSFYCICDVSIMWYLLTTCDVGHSQEEHITLF